MKVECGANKTSTSLNNNDNDDTKTNNHSHDNSNPYNWNTTAPTTPDAALLFSDTIVVVDHEQSLAYIVVLADASNSSQMEWYDKWMEGTKNSIEELVGQVEGKGEEELSRERENRSRGSPLQFELQRPRGVYIGMFLFL